jgi:hypothetical protein
MTLVLYLVLILVLLWLENLLANRLSSISRGYQKKPISDLESTQIKRAATWSQNQQQNTTLHVENYKDVFPIGPKKYFTESAAGGKVMVWKKPTSS